MFGIENLAEQIEELTLQVMALRVDIRSMRVGAVPAQEKVDPVEEQRNRRFSEGLENLMSFDGRVKKGDADDE